MKQDKLGVTPYFTGSVMQGIEEAVEGTSTASPKSKSSGSSLGDFVDPSSTQNSGSGS